MADLIFLPFASTDGADISDIAIFAFEAPFRDPEDVLVTIKQVLAGWARSDDGQRLCREHHIDPEDGLSVQDIVMLEVFEIDTIRQSLRLMGIRPVAGCSTARIGQVQDYNATLTPPLAKS